MTTVASVWTHAQFIDGTADQGSRARPEDRSRQRAQFRRSHDRRLGRDHSGPAQQRPDADDGQFRHAGGRARGLRDARDGRCLRQALRRGDAAEGRRADRHVDGRPVDRALSLVPARSLFALLDEFYPVPQGKTMRAVPFMPYLSFSPSAWVLPLKFDGGGYRAGGKAMFDSEGNLWVGDNFTVGWQAQDTLWQGNATKFAPNGKPLSPITTGFVGGGMLGGTFGAAVDAKDNAWFSSYGGKSIAVFDKNGKPLSPPEGITLNGQLGLMQGIIVAPNGDVWVLGISKNQLVHFPKGDLTKGRIVCEGRTVEPCKSFLGPFHLAIDQQDRIWVSNAVGDFVTRFSAADPSKVETFKAGYSGSGLNIDSQGNVWVTNRLGSAERGKVALEKFQKIMATSYDDEFLVRTMYQQRGADGGSVTLLRPDGTQYSGSPFTGGGLPGPWAAVVDGNDNVWISNFAIAAQPDRAALRRPHRDLPARHEDRRPDLAARRLCGRGPADADRPCDRACGRCLGDEQLAGHRQLLRHAARGALDPLRRPGRHDLLRHGQAGALAADWAGARALILR